MSQNKKIINTFFVLLFSTFCWISSSAQTATLSGVVSDEDNQETLIGATISVEGGNSTITDFDGSYSLTVPHGDHVLVISYVSYTNKRMEINVSGDMVMDIKMKSDIVLKEVVVTADIAIERETPVAFSNIPTRQIQEELAAQDIPMLLNSTPGVYATESGGGDGDARINIRGFDQRRVAVMLDGIPVNDMENGRVFWSNWFGLDLVTQTMQVQRGLGASKLSIPSIGGTINIITKGIDSKRNFKFKQEFGNNGFLRSTFGLTSGRLNNGWGVSLAGSYKRGDGWVDGNYTEGYFYYLRVDKQIGDHLLSFSGFGAPQEHGQRPFTAPIAQVDSDFAVKTGVPQSVIDQMNEQQILNNRGRRFNDSWGLLNGEVFNTRRNYYHKPQLYLRHSWQINPNLFLSNIAYLSIGNGGGVSDEGADFVLTEDGQLDIQKAIDRNQPTVFNPEGLSNTILRASVNNHFWYGGISSLRYSINSAFTFTGGIDARYYKGEHYREVYDLLGGSGYTPNNLQVGDRFDWDYTGFVRQFGVFGLLEFKQEKWTAFANVSRATSGNAFRNNMTKFELDYVNSPSTTLKLGANYNIDRNNTLFINAGFLDVTQLYSSIIITNIWTDDSDGAIAENFENQKIKALELGYNFRSQMFSANLNGYYTLWENKPLDRLPSVPLDPEDPESDRVPVNIPGIDARHVGFEMDFAFKPTRSLDIQGLFSYGDWIWNSSEIATVVLPTRTFEYEFDAEGVHVGDAAQLQVGGSIRYEPIKRFYIKLKGTHFGKNYANFQPEDLKGDTGGRESWQLPSYTIFSFHSGYAFKVKGVGFNVRLNIINLFDATYLTDARNNDDFNNPAFTDFDAKSASVFYGQGRRGTLSFQVNF